MTLRNRSEVFMADKDNGLFILVVLLSCLSFVFSLFSFAPISYNDLEDLPELFEVGNIPNVDLQHGLCLWLPFDGVVLDKSGYSHDTVMVGNMSYSSSVYDRGAVFDGNGDYVNVSDNNVFDFVDGVSICFWVFPVESKTQCCVKKLYGTNGDLYVLNLRSDNTFWFRMTDSVGVSHLFRYTSAISNNEWSFVVATYDGLNARFYINSSLDVKWNDDAFTFASNDLSLFVGQRGDYQEFLNGTIDDMRLYNRVLSEYEIEALYNLNN